MTAHASPDRRLGQRWTALQWCGYLVVRAVLCAFIALADRLSPALLVAFCDFLGRTAYRVLGAARRRARHNAALAMSAERAAQVARRSFAHAGRHLGLSLLLRRPRTRALDLVTISEDALAVLRGALAARRGAIVVSAHLGPFEFIPAALEELGIATAVVVRESYDPALDPFLNAHRRARGIQVIERGARTAPVAMLRALRAGKALGLLPDIGARVPSVPVQLCGRRVLIPVGPQRLARRLRVPLVVGVLEPAAERGRGQFADTSAYALQFERLQLESEEVAATQQVADALSCRILRAPEHWLWMSPGREAPAQKRTGDGSTRSKTLKLFSA